MARSTADYMDYDRAFYDLFAPRSIDDIAPRRQTLLNPEDYNRPTSRHVSIAKLNATLMLAPPWNCLVDRAWDDRHVVSTVSDATAAATVAQAAATADDNDNVNDACDGSPQATLLLTLPMDVLETILAFLPTACGARANAGLSHFKLHIAEMHLPGHPSAAQVEWRYCPHTDLTVVYSQTLLPPPADAVAETIVVDRAVPAWHVFATVFAGERHPRAPTNDAIVSNGAVVTVDTACDSAPIAPRTSTFRVIHWLRVTRRSGGDAARSSGGGGFHGGVYQEVQRLAASMGFGASGSGGGRRNNKSRDGARGKRGNSMAAAHPILQRLARETSNAGVMEASRAWYQ